MPVIAMTREMASGGREVAERLAEKLGLTIILHELLAQGLADRLGVPVATLERRFQSGIHLRERWQVSNQRFAHHASHELLGIAERGDVIIRGWGACLILREVPHAIRVHVCAPLELRLERLMGRGTYTRASALEELKRNDAAHRAMSRSALGVADPDDPKLYDLVLNTERLSVESCADQIARLVATPEFRESEATRGALRDRFLEARIRAALHERFSMATGVADLEIEARDGRVSIAGKALHPELSKDIASLVRGLEGVREVDNHVTIVRPSGLIVARKPRKRTHAPSDT